MKLYSLLLVVFRWLLFVVKGFFTPKLESYQWQLAKWLLDDFLVVKVCKVEQTQLLSWVLLVAPLLQNYSWFCTKLWKFCKNQMNRTDSSHPRCLKITEKVSFNMASEASYVYILSGQKLTKKCQKWSILASFWKPEACGQTVLPDRSVLIGQKLVENAKIQ